MKRYTLLEMVQQVGKSISSDEISTLGESIEAEDIETIVLNVLEDIVNRREWTWRQNQVRRGTPVGGTEVTSLELPDDCDTLQVLRYRNSTDATTNRSYEEVKYIYPEDFLELCEQQAAGNPGTDTVLIGSAEIFVRNNKPPQFYTSFKQGVVMMDSYDSAVDPTGVTTANSLLTCVVGIDTSGAAGNPTYVPDMPTRFFPLWLQESQAVASQQLRKMPNDRAEREARRTYIRLLRLDRVSEESANDREVDYGRKRNY